MESHLSEESLWASALAARLRLLQASFADDEPSVREDFIAQEIDRALKGIVPERRKVLLESLARMFPLGGTAPAPPAPQTPPPPAAVVDESPEAVLERFLAILPALTPKQKADLSEPLKQAGLAAPVQAGDFAAPPELLGRLGIQAGKQINPERAAKALAMLFDMVLTLDQLVWTLWKQVAPKSMIRKEAELSRLAGDYLAAGQEVSTAQLLQALERSRKLVAGLLGAVGRAGATYARERARIFDPNAIEADARAEKKWNESVEFACWRKYVQLCKEYGAEPVIEKGIQEAMVRAAENLIMGRPAG
jgi:hypothetical protein